MDFAFRINPIPYINIPREATADPQPSPSDAPVTKAQADIAPQNKIETKIKKI
jgi:hypothetical protein